MKKLPKTIYVRWSDDTPPCLLADEKPAATLDSQFDERDVGVYHLNHEVTITNQIEVKAKALKKNRK